MLIYVAVMDQKQLITKQDIDSTSDSTDADWTGITSGNLSDFLSLNTKMNMAQFYYDSVSHIHHPASANTHRASNVYESTAENSPQHVHYLCLFDKRLLENYSAQLF